MEDFQRELSVVEEYLFNTRNLSRRILKRFLLGTGRMPHPVGGAMGVTWSHFREKGIYPL